MTGDVVMMSIIYILVIVLLIVLIIIGIKAIFTIDNVNENLREINRKLHSLDGIFNFFDGVSTTLEKLNLKMVSKIDSAFKLMSRFRRGDDEDE